MRRNDRRAKLHRAMKKCEPCWGPNKDQWHGYLLAVDILALNKELHQGFTNEKLIDLALYHKQQGICQGQWVYFKPNPEFLRVADEELKMLRNYPEWNPTARTQ